MHVISYEESLSSFHSLHSAHTRRLARVLLLLLHLLAQVHFPTYLALPSSLSPSAHPVTSDGLVPLQPHVPRFAPHTLSPAP